MAGAGRFLANVNFTGPPVPADEAWRQVEEFAHPKVGDADKLCAQFQFKLDGEYGNETCPDAVDEQLRLLRKCIDMFGENVAEFMRVLSAQIYNEMETQMRHDMFGNEQQLCAQGENERDHPEFAQKPEANVGKMTSQVVLEKAREAVGYVDGRRPSQGTVKQKEDTIQRKSHCFADEVMLKAHIREALYKKPYNVFDFYWEEGVFQRIAKSPVFYTITLAVIACNALWIAVDTDNNDASVLLQADLVFQVAEQFFCVYFFIEWFVRFMAFRYKRSCLQDGWFLFDSFLMSVTVLETWVVTVMLLITTDPMDAHGFIGTGVLRLFRLLRLTRIARIVRLVRIFPELLPLIKGISIAFRSVFFTLALLMGVVYVFSIGFTQLAGFTEKTRMQFPSVTQSMLCLFLRGAFPDVAEMVEGIADESLLLAGLMVLYLLIGAVTIMNMLVGILVEVVSVVSHVEKEQLSVYFVRQQLTELCVEHGINTDPEQPPGITKAQFLQLIEDPQTASIIDDTGADPVNVIDFITFLYKTRKELSFGNVVEVILNLRPTNASTVKDVADVRKLVVSELVSHLGDMENRIILNMQEMQHDAKTQCSFLSGASLRKRSRQKSSANGVHKAPSDDDALPFRGVDN
eukprot:TRINITY_DN5456_c0_g3_i1.p1 TRINITY_DN5456_c0_g3~~TRINITY_DN5456_c0_g3_i1.p1  ORF type:complete len:631 (-),score=88.80 TRINITY_DN5456_c0_g3_i1:181-2073(-)